MEHDETSNTPEHEPVKAFGWQPGTDYDGFEGNPVIDAAIEALTFGGHVPVAEIPRDRAARLLSMWSHDSELTDRERQAVLNRFPSPATVRPRTVEIRQAQADFVHAFTVDFDPDANLFVWRCRCGWQHAQALDERDVRTSLIMHLEGGEAGGVYPPVAEYRKRLDAWSKDAQIEQDQRDREQQ